MSTPERIVLGVGDQGVWDEALATLPGGDASHDWRWGEVLRSAYGWKPHRALWRAEGRWLGALQAHSGPWPLSAQAVSSPFLTTGGLLVRERGDAPALHVEVGRLAGDLGLRRIDCREADPACADRGEFTFELALTGREALWKGFPSKLRSQIRKPQKDGYTVVAVDGPDLAFYPQFQRKMHEFGTPVHAARLFSAWLPAMPGVCRQFVVRDPQGAVVGGMLMLLARGRASIPFAVVHEPERPSAANMLLYAEALGHACDAGCTVADFGRSQRDSGTFKFKGQWGGTAVPLVNRRCTPAGVEERGFGELRGGMAARFTALWPRLPRWCADRAGPRLRRYIP